MKGAAMVGAAALVLGISALLAPGPAGIDRQTTGSVAVDAAAERPHYRVVAPGDGARCGLRRGPAVEPGTRRLELFGACDALMQGLSRARYWREQDDGSVALVLAQGRTLVEFAAGDGVAYESFRPGAPMLALVAVR
ncbi:hypothetical protein N1F89_02820 [Aquibium sp. A9E412]|uniref:hypothetical protein n=1 Tax=Aquibium sp. A9E412 TaxID=2976767 RepID=UPI0025AF9F60|nr:hypothetical protein [Aquibium sp. A9E412]MDN2565143.1 hypothetical protein [Aquibium sp. A9E412]